jgi:toxin ParE1/3/4
MPVENYAVFYIPDESTRTVTIIRIMYGARDVDKQLNTGN